MICAHCKARSVNIAHVKACARVEVRVRSIGQFEVEGPALQQTPRTPPPFAAFTLARRAADGEDIEGVYFKDDWYYKVVQGTNTGNWYAKVWESPLGDGQFEWSYAGRKPLYSLTEEHRISAEDAARFGQVTGTCVFCGRKLTDERSIDVGYGPKCAAKNGLPWGEVANA